MESCSPASGRSARRRPLTLRRPGRRSTAATDVTTPIGPATELVIGYMNRLQFCLAFETELAHGVVPGWSLVGRVHHRSGSFGILAEKDSGSSFIGMGLRRDF